MGKDQRMRGLVLVAVADETCHRLPEALLAELLAPDEEWELKAAE